MQRVVDGFENPAMGMRFEDGIWIVEALNQAIEELFHRGAEDSIDRPAREVVPSVDMRIRARSEAELARAGFWRGKAVLRTARGDPLLIYSTCTRMLLPGGREMWLSFMDPVKFRAPVLCPAKAARSPIKLPATSIKPGDTCNRLSQTNAGARARLPVVPRETATSRRNRKLAYNLRRLRGLRGWTQEQLALRADLNREQIVHWENEDYGISPASLERLCKALDLDDDHEFYVPIPEAVVRSLIGRGDG